MMCFVRPAELLLCILIVTLNFSAGYRTFNPDPELSEICTKLWELDENRCDPGTDYEIDIQGYLKSTRNRQDWAGYPLFSYFDEEKVFSKPTYNAFKHLLDNYETSTKEPERVTKEEEQENRNFIDAIMETPVMQEAHRYLVSKGKAPEGKMDFKRLLYKIWFYIYKRTRQDKNYNSSGFEHVFVGESRDHDVIGFHNWIQFYLQEKHGKVDYKGYFDRGTTDEAEAQPRLVTLQFTWGKTTKPIGSSFIGTSPEFEIALYTLIFLIDKGEKIPLEIADYKVEIHCFHHGKGIGTAYPQSKEG